MSAPNAAACRACGGRLESVLDLGHQPLANALLAERDAPERAFPLELARCADCGLAQLATEIDPAALFSDYFWVTGTSSTARRQSGVFRDGALARARVEGRAPFVVEAASNDGTYLRAFAERGCRILGVDPAANLASAANAAGVSTICGFFDAAAAERIVARDGHADIVVARNVLAHVPDPIGFLRAVAHVAGPAGLAATEFHYAARIQDGLQYDSIYHEHACYLTATVACTLLAKAGLVAIDMEEGPISGGALIVYARAAGHAPSPAVAAYLEAEAKAGRDGAPAWRDFARRVRAHRTALCAALDGELAQGRRVMAYGASARSSTLLNYCGISSDRVGAIADANPLKHGRFAAGSRLPILPAERVVADAPDTILLLAWNFRDEILGELRGRLGFGGRIILPLPGDPQIVD